MTILIIDILQYIQYVTVICTIEMSLLVVRDISLEEDRSRHKSRGNVHLSPSLPSLFTIPADSVMRHFPASQLCPFVMWSRGRLAL